MRWRRSQRVLWRAAPNHLVLATVDGRTIEVEGPGADIWARLGRWLPEEELIAALTDEYGADRRIVSRDVQSLLEGLHAQGYVDRDG